MCARDVVQEALAQALRDQEGIPRRRVTRRVGVADRTSGLAIGSKGSRELTVDELPEVAFVDDRTRAQLLAAAVRELPPQRRMAIFLRYFADLTYAEIGEVLGIAEGTVAATLSQAHQQLDSRAFGQRGDGMSTSVTSV